MPKTPVDSTSSRKRIRLSQNSTTYDIASLKKKKLREEIQTLLEEAERLKPLEDNAKKRLTVLREKLTQYAIDLDTNGFRTDKLAFQFGGIKTKRTLSPTLLIESGVDVETLNACYLESDEYADTKFVMFDEASK